MWYSSTLKYTLRTRFTQGNFFVPGGREIHIKKCHDNLHTFYDLMRNEFRFFIYVWGGFEYIWTIISENVKKCFIDTTCTLMFITSLNLQIQYSVLPSWVNEMIYIKMLQIIESIKHGQPSFIVNLIWLEKKKNVDFGS